MCTLEEAQMSRKPLTAAAVRKYAPGSARRRIPDPSMRSLFLIIEPSGHKAWQMRFRVNGGRIGKLTLGPVDLSGNEMQEEPAIGQPLTLRGKWQPECIASERWGMTPSPTTRRRSSVSVPP